MADDRISKNLHLVYSALKSEGYTDIGDEQDFIKKMQDEQNRLKVYNALKGAGYSDMGSDFKSFSGMIYTAPQPKPQAAAAPAASPQSSPTTIQTNVVQPVVQTPATQQQTTSAAPREVKKGDGSMLMAPKQEQPSFKFNFTAQTYHGVPMLQNDEKGNPKVSGGTFNPVTGQYEGEGSFYTDWLGNKIPVNSDYGKAAVAYQQHVKDVSPINAELEEAYKERDRINKMLSDRMGEIDKAENDQPWYIKMLREGGRAYAGDKMGGAGSATDYQLKYNSDQKYRNIMSAARKNRAAIKALEDKKNGKQNEFWHAFGNAITNGYTFSQGDSDWGDVNALIDAQKHMPEIERKQKTGEKLTKDEEIAATVIKNHAWDNDVQQRYGDEYGAWARAGETAVGSLELGIDFLTMGPELKATAGSVMKLTEKGATKVLGDAATKGLGKFMTKATGVTVGSMIAGAEMSNTVGLNRTMSDVGKRYLGNVTVNEEDGSYQFDGGKGFLQSLYEAEMAASIENGSEVLGEFLPGSGMLLKGLEKVGMKKVANGLTRLGGSTWYKNYTKALESIGFHGVGGEAVEEYAGLLGNALLVGDNKFSDLLDPKTHVDIWLGCAVTGGLLNAPRTVGYAAQGANKGYQAAQYYRYKHKTDKADAAANAVWGDEWVDLRDRIDGTSNEDMTDIATSIYTDADMTPEQKRTALDYIGNLTAMRGYNMGRISMEREDENGRGTTDDERSLNNAFAAGYNATEQEDMEDAKNAYDMHRQLAENSLDEWTLSALDGNETGIDGEPLNPLHILGNMAYSPIVGDAMTDEQRKIAADYLNAKARYDGMLQRVRDDIDSRISASDAAIDQRTNRVGLIQPATMKLDDRRVYVVDGNLVMHEDGSMIDVANSGESILVRDAETGKLEWASPHDFLSVDEEIDPAAEKEAAQAAIREQYAEEQAQKIDGALPFNDGDIYSVMEEDGTQWTAQILADNGDGTVQVAWNGNVNNPQTVSKDFVQELSTNAAMARLAQNEQERAMQEQLDKEDEFQQERPVYNLNDEVTLRGENGEPVRGSITTEENEDGQIEVYTETPINGKKIHMFTRQQIDDMLMEHNGEAVVVTEAPAITAEIDNAGAVQSEPSTVQNDVENVPETTENVSNTDENVPAAEETVSVEPMPMVGEGEDAEPDFGATTPQRAHDYIFNESGLEEADAAAFTKNNVEAANKELEKIKNKKPKMGTSIAKFNKDKAEWEQKVNEAQAKADYWKQVKEARDKVLAQRLAEQQERERQQIEQAQADEAAYREEMARKEAEQAALGTNNVSPAIRDKWVNAPKVEGAQDEIVLPNGEKVAGRYYLVESGAASASHDSNNGFAKTEGFPVDENGGSVNDRDYERDMDAQRITRDIANNYDSRAVQTPVVVSQDGVVLSGNGRTMAGELAAAQYTDAAYNSHIAQYPTKWGFTQQQVEGMQHPRVVFVPDAAMPYTAETFAKFNQQEMKGQSKTEQAVKLGKVVSDKAFNRIIGIINRFDTLGDFYADSKATSEAITELQGDGVLSQAQMAEMYDGDGISAIGKELLENTLIGKAFESNPNAVREITEYKSMRQSIITALAEISNNLSLGKEYSLESELAQAIDLVYQARNGGSKFGEPVSWFARQQNLDFFGFSDTVADYNNATMLMIADIINDNRSSRLKKYIQIYNHNAQDSANGQLDLFTGSVQSKEDIINEVKQLFNNGSEEEQQKAAQEAVARRKAESVQENGTVANGSEAEPAGEVTETPAVAEGVETPATEEAPTMSLDNKRAIIQQYLMEMDGATELLNVMSEDEMDLFMNAMDAWEVANEEYGNVMQYFEPDLKSKNKETVEHANARIKGAHDVADERFAVVEQLHNNLCEKYNISTEEAETPAAEPTGTVASKYDEAKEFYRKNYSLQPLLAQLREQQRFVREGRGDEDVVRAILDILNEDYGNGEQNDLATAIAAAEAATEANPTDAQKEAGNYKKGHVKVDGFDITIENAKGSTRRGKDADGKEWSVTMNNTYGYIRGTEGVDGDHIDIYLSDDPSNGNVFVIDQVKADGTFDEHKVMYGFASAEEAHDNYLANYSEGWTGLGTISEVTKDEFKKWIESSHRKTKPFADYKNVKVEGAQNEAADGVVTPAAEKTDEQGNPLNEDGTLKLEKLSSIDEITDEDFSNPTRSVELPTLPKKVDEAIGANGKPVIIKKNIFERNAERHADLTADDSRNILQSALYNPNLYGQNQKAKRPYNWVVINTKDKEGNNRLVLLELSPEKENAEIVHWHYIDDKGLEKIKRQAEREDGQLLILPSESEEAGALSSPTNDLSSGSKVTNNSASDQENGVKSYKISAFEYTTKRGKKLNMQLVTFESELSKEQMNAAKKLAKDLKGWWSKDDGGFLMRDADSAQQLAESVFGDEEAVANAQPVTLEDMKLVTAEPVAEQEEGFHGGDTVWSKQHGENKHILMAHHANGAIQSYTFTDGTKAMAQEVEAAHEEERDPRWHEGWDGDYVTWKARQDYLDEIERKEQAAADEGRVAYFVAGADSMGQRNGTFHKVWLMPEDVVTENGQPRYNGRMLWTRDEAYHTEEGFQLGNIYYTGEEFADAFPAPKEEAATEQETEQAPVEDEGTRAMQLFDTISEGDVFVNDNGLKVEIVKKVEGKRKGISNAALEVRWTQDNGKQERQTGDVKIYNALHFMQYLEANNLAKAEAPAEEQKGSGNKIVTDERYEQLKARMRKKLGQLNVSIIGIDPEMLAIGTEMAVYHIEKGARQFIPYAKAMIEDLGEAIRPYLKSFYNGARDLPEIEANGWTDEMTPYDEVRKIDVANFDQTTTNAMATADMVVKEEQAAQQAEAAKEQIIETRNNNRNEAEQQTETNTQAVADEAAAVASETESVVSSGDSATISEQVSKIDAAMEKVNKQLALLGYYEADDIDPSKFHESYGYMKTAEKKAVADALKLSREICKALGMQSIPKRDIHANIAPIGGDVTFRIPLSDGKSLYFNIGLENDHDNLSLSRIMYRVEEKQDGAKYWNSVGHANNYLSNDVTVDDAISDIKRMLRYDAPEFEIKEAAASTSAKQSKSTENKPKSKKKSVPLQQEQQLDLFGDLFADLNEQASETSNSNNNETTDVQSRTEEEGREGQQPQQDAQVGRSAGHEAEGTDGRGMGGRSSLNSVSDGERSLGVSGTPQSQQHVDPAADATGTVATENEVKTSGTVAKNTNNNHAERGKDYAPKGVDARIEANIKAIELMHQLMLEGKQATPAQMKVLRQYSGWGGLGKAFNENPNGPYSYNPTTKRLKELLGDDAFRLAEDSRDSAFYTPAVVIDTMWDVARAMGFKGGTVLEGSAGIGNIIGAMPTDMSKRSDIHAVEIDETTGNILSLLYPDAKVDIQGFEQTKIANGSVDLAITNVPFVTGLNVRDESGDLDLSKKFKDIHDFCIAKNVRKLREGGIGIFITSNGTLDNSQKLRNWLVGEGGADVVGAFRLHNKTFGGAKVTSDIIVVRKRVNGQKSAHAIDVSTVTAERTGTFVDEKQRGKERTVSMDYNKYFMEHPECMAGEMFFGYEKGDTYRPSSKSLYPVNGKEQETMLAEWVKGFEGMKDENLRKTAGNGGSGKEKQQDTVYESLGEDVKEGSLILDKDGKLCVAQYGKAVPLSVNANKVKGHTKAECFQSYQAIKSALTDVLAYQTENEDDEGLKPLLDKLNKAYDGFVKTYGHLHKNTSISFLKNDVDFPNILALEKYSEEGDKNGNKVDKFEKTDIFKQRVVEKDKAPEPKNVKDGIIASIYQYGRIDVPYIAEKLGKSVDDVKQEIVSSGLGFENPITLQMEVSYEYLSGNVREKLKQAEEANEGGKYAANIEALRKVIPMDIPAHLIDFTLGSSWVEPKLYEDFIKERTDVDAQLTNVGGTWYMKVPYYVQHEKNKAMGVRGEVVKKLILGSELIEAALQNKTITVSETHSVGYGSSKTTETITDKEATQACAAKIDEIRADFKEWARQKMQSDAEMSARIEKAYNEQFNNYVPVDVSMDFVPEYFGGANHKFKMREHQAKAIVRGTMQPLLLAHEVGTGKTFTLISTAMEMRRLGTAKKPMIVVQNATVGQFVASAKELYPNAKVLTLEDKDHTGEGRKNFYAKIKYNDWDMIVVPQSVFERIPDSEERQMRFIQDKIDEKIAILEQMREADQSGRSAIVRQAEKEIEQLKDQLGAIGETATTKRKQRDSKREHITRQNTEVKAREMLDRETDDVENFDDMGIDAILVDEAHEYKHLGFATAMQRGVKGIDPSYSKKSQGVYLKTQAVLEKNNGRNVIFATGTPISNTAAEIWTFMRYLMPADTMKDYGIYYFDDFVRNFGNLTQMLEFTTNGKFKENNRFAGYVNLPELVRIWSSVADTVRTDEAKAVKDNVPDMEGGQAQDIYLPQTRALRSIMKFVKAELERFEKMSGKEKKENSHIPLTMYGVAKAAAVDARLVMADAEDDPNSKTNEAVRQTLKSLKETAKYKGTVALFADNYQNKHSGFNLYDDIREKLIAQGVPANEVVVIRSGMTIKKKQEIFDKVNRGEIRVILGSTFTLGTGVNIQERLHTLIHLDAPNRPMDYTQRNGRIVRQGNLHKVMGIPVRVLRFGVQDSLDVTAYQRLKTKGAIADSIMKGKAMMQNSMEDRAMEEDEDVFGDTVAQLSGSQYAMLKNQAEREVRKYESKRKQWEADQTYVHNAIPRITAQIAESERKAAENNANLAKIEEAFGGSDKPAIKVGKHTFADIAGMSDFFTEQNKKVKETEDEIRKSTGEEQRTRTVDVQIGNATFTIKTTQKKELSYHGGTVDTKVSRSITISCPELGIEDMKGGAYFKNAMENIFNDVVSGSAFREDAAYYSTREERLKGELELVKSREGQPFQYDKELEDARQKYDEYTDLMKKEMEEKEKKYAEMDSDVEAATGITDAEEADEDSDSEVRFRDSLPNATAEDKDLRFSLRVDPAPNTSKTAYAVFIVKRHEDGSVSLHPKMLADEAVGAPPHTWLNADTGKIKRDKNGNPIENTRGRVSVRDAHGAPLAWRPGKHLAPYPNASQFAVEGDTKGVRDRLPDDVIFFEVEYAADRDYQLEAWEYGVNANGKYEHSQAGLPYIPKDGYYIYRTNANPNIPAMIITGAYRVKRALNDEEAKRLNQEAGGDWFDRKSGEPMTDERLKELGLDEAGLERKAQTFEYDELEPAHDESSVAMGMRGYVRRDLDFSDKNLLKAIAENQRSLKDFPSVDYFAQKYAEEKENDRQREVTTFEDGQVLPVEYDWVNDGYKVEGLNALYTNIDRLLDDFRDKYPEYIATMSKDKESIEVTSWRGVINDTRKPRLRNGQPTKAEQAKAAYIERKTRRAIDAINAEAKRLGLKVEVRTDTEGLKGRRARAKGWYDTKTGKIVIIIPNHTNGGDVMRTLLHEGVAHYGLRELFGEDFDNFLDNVYNNVDEATRKQIADLAAKNNWDFKVATEEYLASLAEDTNFERAMSQSWWNKIKFLFLEMLRKAGVKLDRTLRDADLRYILWRSYENLATAGEHGILRAARNEVMQERLGVGNYGVEDNTRSVSADAVAEDEMRYRDGDIMDERDQAIVRDRYDRMMQSGMYQFREAMQDSMLSLRRLMEYISQATGEKVKDFENAYMAENALSSKNHAEQDLYGKLLFNPMLDEIHRLAKEDSSRDEVTRYMMAKHGLERNEVMAARAAKKAFESEDNKDASGNPIKSEADFLAEYRERDFGGITGLMEEDDLVIAEGLAQQLVSDFENNHDVDELWARTNACTKATLEKTYKAGLLSKSGYDEISGMYEYYIPLRGFDATTSDEVYSYLNHERSGFSTPLKKAEGRKSVADDPIATIANMADSAIVQGNCNMMKQKFLKFAMNHPSDAVSVNRMWLRYDNVNDVWEAVTAKIDENDTPDEVLQKTEQFEETMRQLAEADPDHYKRGKDAANIPYKTLGKSLNEHQVHVKLGGDDYILTINGSPRAAQALNGLTNPDNDTAGAVGAILKAGEYVNRQMSAFYTTRNPEFVLSNFLRDAMYANSTMWVRERPNYAIKFNKNFLKVNPTVLYGLIKKHNAGKLDMNVEIERAFYQFMMNGGETGYTVVKDIDKQKKLIKKYVRMKDATIPVEAAWKLLGDKLDDINRSVENCARFAAFLTSRQMGRTVERSVFDAKEVSVNFNKKGAGSTFMGKTDQTKLGNLGAFTSGLGRSFYVFWNAAVQGTTNFASLHKHHTGKALALDAGLFLLGAIISGLGGGDDDDYWNLPSYVRRSNICFKIPHTDSFVSIPLGIEQRAIYGLGELFSSLASGRERMSGKEIAKEIAGSLSSMLPLDLMESNGDISWSTVSPSYVKPFVETANNKDWKGMPIYKDTPYNKEDPEWTKASKRTNQYLVDFSKWCNELTGGDEVKKGWLNFNPSKIEHMFEGVFGGVSTTANKLVKEGEMVAGKQDFDWSNILIASRVVKSADENAEARRINAEYWKYYGEYKETKRLVDHYEDQESEGIMGTAEKLNFMYNSPEYGRYEIVDDYYSEVKDLSDELNETTNEEERNELETEINELKREMVEAIRAYDDARK